MRRTIRVAASVLAVGLALCASRADAADISWKNPAGGTWSTASNWDPAAVPGAGDNAIITLAGTYTVTLNVTAAVASLTIGGAAGTQTLSHTSQILTLNNTSTINSNGVYLLNGGTLAGAGDLIVKGSVNWMSGTLSGSGVTNIAAGSTLVVGGSGSKSLRRSINNAGTVSLTSTVGISSGDGAVFNNQAGGTLSIQNDSTWNFNLGGASPQFNNQLGATVTKTGTNGTTTFSNVPFNNNGVVNVDNGVLALNGGGASNGPFNIAAMARVDFASAPYTLNSGASLAGAGSTRVSGGTLAIAADVMATHVELTSGTLTGGANLTVTSTFEFAGGTMAGSGMTVIPMGTVLNFSGNASKNLRRSINNAGTTTWTGGANINSGDGAVFTNQAGGTFNIQSDETFFFNLGGTNTQFINQAGATVTKSTTSGTTTFANVPFNNSGTVNISNGVLSLSGGGSSSTPFNIEAAARWEVPSNTYTLNAGANLAGAGIARVSGGGMVVIAGSVSATTFELVAGTLTGGGNFTISNTLEFSSGTMAGSGTTVIPVDAMLNFSGNGSKNLRRSVNNAGTTTWTGGANINSGDGAVFTNQSGATFFIQNDAFFLFNLGGATSQFVNQSGATVIKSTTGGTTTFSAMPFNNSGTVNVANGALALSGGGASNAPFTIAAAARFEIPTGTYTMNAGAGFTGAGTARISGSGILTIAADMAAVNLELVSGTLTGGGTLTVGDNLDWTGGTMAGSGATVIPMLAKLNIGSSAAKNLRRSVNNAGTCTWTGVGNINSGDGAVFTNQAGATFNIQTDQFFLFNLGGATSQFINQGGATLTKMITGGTVTFSNLPFNNSGTVNIVSGVLALTGGGASSAPFNIGASAAVEFPGGVYTLNAGAGFTGAGTARISGSGTLTIAADVGATKVSLEAGTLNGGANLTVSQSMQWIAGTMSGSGATIVAASAALAIDGPAVKTLRRPLRNAGAASWTGFGGVNNGDGSVFTNQAGGTFSIQNDAAWSFNLGGATSRFENQTGGTVTKSNSGGTTTFSNLPFANAGAVNANSGILRFTGTHLQTAGATHLAGGDLSTIDTINIQGGMIDGTGTITGNLSDGGNVNPGLSPGKINCSGNYTQTSGGAFNVEINGADPDQFDQLDIVGAVSLAGSLNVSLGFTPMPGSSFTVINNQNADAVSGTFSGFPEGAMFNIGGTDLQITYVGGSGNDVVLTVVGGATQTPEPTLTPTVTATSSSTETPAATTTPSPTSSAIASPTSTFTSVASPTPTLTPAPTGSPTTTATASFTPTFNITPTHTPIPPMTGTFTPTDSPTSTPTSLPSQTTTHTATLVPTPSQTTTPVANATNTFSPTPTASATATATLTPSRSPTGTPLRIEATCVVSRPPLPGEGTSLRPAVGAPVDVHVCARQDTCLRQPPPPFTSSVTGPTGRAPIVSIINLVPGQLLLIATTINQTPLRTIVPPSRLGFGSGPFRMHLAVDGTELLVDPISEAAVRLLEDQGIAGFTDTAIDTVIDAVEMANTGTSFADLSVEQAAGMAESIAAADPEVQRALHPIVCIGDCDDSGDVTVDEIIKGVNIALGNAPLSSCPQFDSDGSGDVTIDELITAVNNALNGCPLV